MRQPPADDKGLRALAPPHTLNDRLPCAGDEQRAQQIGVRDHGARLDGRRGAPRDGALQRVDQITGLDGLRIT